jgi:hypothetical protein
MGLRPVVLTCGKYMGKQLGAGAGSRRGNSIAGVNGAHLVGLFSMLMFGFTFKAISPVHILRLVVPTVDIHRRRV